jgi:hypothetical protein
MPIFELALLLAAAGVAASPCWRYSAEWGYWPSASVGVLLLFVAVFAASGAPVLSDGRKATSRAAMTTTGAISAPDPTAAQAVAGREPDIKSDR